jgi:hypothetical protein
MSNNSLTDAIIKKIEFLPTIVPEQIIPTNGPFKKSSYFLIVRLVTKSFAKMTIYPLNNNKILKLTFTGFNIQTGIIKETVKKLNAFKIVHTSGLNTLRGKSYYECYLNLSFNHVQYIGLKRALDKIKNKFEDINIVEIS